MSPTHTIRRELTDAQAGYWTDKGYRIHLIGTIEEQARAMCIEWGAGTEQWVEIIVTYNGLKLARLEYPFQPRCLDHWTADDDVRADDCEACREEDAHNIAADDAYDTWGRP